MYTVEGLQEGIVNCRRNIKVLQKAIEDEQNTIKNYRCMIDDIELAEKKMAEAMDNVSVECGIQE